MSSVEPTRPPAGTPFITRRSLLWFSGVATGAFIAFNQLYDASNQGAGALGIAAAMTFAVALVVGAVAWLGGIRLAGRSGSLLWLFLVALMPPIGSLAYALWGPNSIAAPPRPGARR